MTAIGTGAAMGPDVHRFSHEAMATVFEIRCAHPDPTYAAQAAQAAFARVDRLEQSLSRFVSNSDVARINALEEGQGTPVEPDTLECLQLARHMLDVTGGAFDVSLGTGLASLEIGPDAFRVHARRGGVQLDLGGIGKGYAVDRAGEVLEEWGIRSALVHGGFSSVLALDPPPGREGWPLVLRAPEDSRVLARIEGRQEALSASGTRKGRHIFDPRSGAPVSARAAWAAVGGRVEGAAASLATTAEALSTAFMVLPDEEIARLCRLAPRIRAWVVTETGVSHHASLPQEPAAGEGAPPGPGDEAPRPAPERG